jgi:hypothetical protein
MEHLIERLNRDKDRGLLKYWLGVFCTFLKRITCDENPQMPKYGVNPSSGSAKTYR